MTSDAPTPSIQEWLDGIRALKKGTLHEAFDMEIVDATDETFTIRMPITNATRQPMGLWHGGMSMVIAESAASLHATWNVDMSQKAPVGVEISGSHLRSASEGWVRAEARVLRRSRNFIVHAVDIIHEETGKVMCAARVTNYYLRLDEVRGNGGG